MVIKSFLNLNFISLTKKSQKRSMLDLNERVVCWWGLTDKERDMYYTEGFTMSYPGPMEEKAMWNEWYTKEFLPKRPKTFFKRLFYVWFIEAHVMYTELYNFPMIKAYMDAAKDPYWELYVDEILNNADDWHVEIFACWQADNWERQFGMEGIFWIMNFFFWDYVFERWNFSQCIFESFFESVLSVYHFFELLLKSFLSSL